MSIDLDAIKAGLPTASPSPGEARLIGVIERMADEVERLRTEADELRDDAEDYRQHFLTANRSCQAESKAKWAARAERDAALARIRAALHECDNAQRDNYGRLAVDVDVILDVLAYDNDFDRVNEIRSAALAAPTEDSDKSRTPDSTPARTERLQPCPAEGGE